MGTQKKMNYTIISNAVNLTSRLEGINKQYGTWVLASEAVVQETGGRLLTRRLDRIRVVGIQEPVRIYEVMEINADAPDALHERIRIFHKALEFFEGRDWKEAETVFAQVLKISPKDGPSLLFLDRCRRFQNYPPAPEWDGVFNFTEK
jgi:adenylate cyclase